METIPERLDWLWVLGYDLNAAILNHSVLSKARRRWGPAVFQRFFEHIVWQWVEAGLVDERKIFVDASLVEAHAANSSIVDTHSLFYMTVILFNLPLRPHPSLCSRLSTDVTLPAL